MVSGGGGGGGVALGATSKKGKKKKKIISRAFCCHFPLEGSLNSLKFTYMEGQNCRDKCPHKKKKLAQAAGLLQSTAGAVV